MAGSAFAVIAGPIIDAAPSPHTNHTAPLIVRIGGIRIIAEVVDDFVERACLNKALSSNSKIADAIRRASTPQLKFELTLLLSERLGGPHKYFGSPIKALCSRIVFLDRDWRAMRLEFEGSLERKGVPENLRKEWLSVVDNLKGDVVTYLDDTAP